MGLDLELEHNRWGTMRRWIYCCCRIWNIETRLLPPHRLVAVAVAVVVLLAVVVEMGMMVEMVLMVVVVVSRTGRS
jgi:hypothetical protein